MWIWGIIPVVTILIFFAKFGIKKTSIFLQVRIGMLLWNSGYWCFVCLVLYNKLLVQPVPIRPDLDA